jgi:ribosome biogenesis GTPase / thiamine phosphate phosphatase
MPFMRNAVFEAPIQAAYGRLFTVIEPNTSQTLQCVTRGKKIDYCVGDLVQCAISGDGTAVIETLVKRESMMKRSDHRKTKLIASNLDQVFCVVATEPSFSEALVGRVLLAAFEAQLPVVLILNKCDLQEALDRLQPRIALYEALGYSTVRVQSKTQPEATFEQLAPMLQSKTTLLLGQSGMGKSTLVNALIPEAEQATREISQVLASGKHTTTFTKSFALKRKTLDGTSIESTLIDSPGFQEYGLSHLHPSEVAHGMPEFKALLGQCQFRDCRHADEPGCAVRAAVKAGAIDSRRYELYQTLLNDMSFYDEVRWKSFRK